MYSFGLNVLLGLIPECLYFTLFIIYTKKYKTKRILLFILLLAGYIILKFLFPINITFQILYILYVPLILKLLYKNKFHITDIFVFVYASIFLIIITLISLPIFFIFNQYIIAFILNRILMFLFLILFKDKFNIIYKKIISQWNRNYQKKNKFKAITIRQICVISLNIMVFVLNIWISYIINK